MRSNAIHLTYNRAVTTQGVHFFRIQRNVAYHILGHIEDGIETQNIFEDNLGISTLASWSLLNTDQTPATFWITNPYNYFRGNRAAGGDRYGFWFDLRANPSGPSVTTQVCPRGMRLGEFKNNVAHSYQRYVIRVFDH